MRYSRSLFVLSLVLALGLCDAWSQVPIHTKKLGGAKAASTAKTSRSRIAQLGAARTTSYGSYYRSKGTGNWNDISTWEYSTDGGETWSDASTVPSYDASSVHIRAGHTVTVTANASIDMTKVDEGGTLVVDSGVTLTVGYVDGTIKAESTNSSPKGKIRVKADGGGDLEVYGILMIKGNFEFYDGSFNGISDYPGRVIYNGSVPQTLFPFDWYWDLEINNPAGVDLEDNVWEIDGTLAIVSGNLRTSSDYEVDLDGSAVITENAPFEVLGWLYTSATCTTGVSQSFGGLGVEITPNGGGSPYFEVYRATGEPLPTGGGAIVPGDASFLKAGKANRVAGVGSTGGPANAILRYFDIWTSPDTGLHATMVFHYNPGELNGATESFLRMYESDNYGSTWSNVGGSVNTSAHTITLSGINSFSLWAAGSTIPLPSLTDLTPKTAVIGSTFNLIITGTNFFPGSTVSFSGSGITVNSVAVNSSEQITANVTVTSSAAPTYRDVIVTTSYGSATYSNGFGVLNPAPMLTSLSPTSGDQGQLLDVVLNGSGFISGVTTVSFGADVTVNSLSVTNDHTLTAHISIPLAAVLGPRNVSVTNPSPGGGTATLTSAFTINNPNPAPTIASILPSSAVVGQVLNVVVTGTNFIAGVTTLTLGADVGLDSIKFLSGTQIQARLSIPFSALVGSRSATVTNAPPGGGTATLASAFTINNPAPTITSVVPGIGGRGKLVSVTINGSGFIPGVTSALPAAGLTLVSATFVSPTQITGSLFVARDAALGFRDMTMVNAGPGGGPATLTNAFEVQNPSPTVISVSPNTGLIGQSLSVVVSGSDFIAGVSSVDFGAGITVGAVTIDTTGTHLTAAITIVTGALAGSRNVTVTNSGPGGGSSTLANGFTVANPAPTLTVLSTYAAGRGQTLNVIMTGTNFATGVSSASFGVGITVNSLTVSSPTSATANITVAPAAIIGARGVSITNAPPGGGTATIASVFNVGNPNPTLATITPASGARGATLDVVITGTGFLAGVSALTLGSDVTVNSFTVTSFTQINANITVPFADAAGARDVTVSNGPPGGGAGLLAAGFTVNNPLPTISSVTASSANRGSIVNETVTGSQFITGVTSLSFGSDITVNSTVVKSTTEILANITVSLAAVSGSRTVTVTNAGPGGGSANLPAGFTVGTGPATSVEGDMGVVPDQFVLQEAYPNPFNPSTRIRYGVPEDSRVRIDIHNMLGNIVAELVNGARTKGTYEIQWHADYLPSGVYLVRMNAESTESNKRYISSRKIILMK